MKAIVLAAGLGTRLRPVTDVIAKPAISFLNIPLLYYPVAFLDEAGVDELVVNLHHKPEQIENLTRKIPGYHGRTRLSYELEKPLGPGGGIWKARPWLDGDEDFFVANGDEVILPSHGKVLANLMKAHQSKDALATLLVMRHAGVGTQFGGVWTDSEDRVYGFGKQKLVHNAVDLFGFHYIGIFALSPRVFQYLPEGESNIFYDVLAAAIRAGELVQVFEDQCRWFETGNSADFIEGTRQCLELLRNEKQNAFLLNLAQRFWPDFSSRRSLWHGHSSNIELRSEGLCPESLCLIGDNVQVVTRSGAVNIPATPPANHFTARGFCVIGNNATLGPGCILEESVVLPNANVEAGAHLRRTIVTPNPKS